MGTTYEIRCKHCGMQLSHAMRPGYSPFPIRIERGGYIETETPIRCPACLRRLNPSAEAFDEQIEAIYRWG